MTPAQRATVRVIPFARDLRLQPVRSAPPSELTDFTNLTNCAVRSIFGREENAMATTKAKSRKPGILGVSVDPAAAGAAFGAFVLDADTVAGSRTTIPIASKAIGTLSRNRRRVGQLIDSFGAALERMQRTGRAVRLTVDVEPKGALKIREIDAGSDAAIADARPAVASAHLDRALAAARERGRRRVAEILSDPDMLSADNLARLLGTTRATINAKRLNHQLLGLEGATRGFRFPSWQIGEDGKPFAALPALFERLGDSPWAVYRFLVQSHPELDGETGRDALRIGRNAEVVEAAESVAEAFA